MAYDLFSTELDKINKNCSDIAQKIIILLAISTVSTIFTEKISRLFI